MPTKFSIQSSDPALLERATGVAQSFARKYMTDEVAGIVFLGAIARGYFDRSADIDMGVFLNPGVDLPFTDKFFHVEGFEIQVWLSDYGYEITAPWDMPKRWTYSQGQVGYDPQGKIAELLREKVPLRPEERKWLMMSGLTLSEWYIRRLTQTWVERGNLVSAHQLIDPGLIHFYDMLFGLNNELVPDMKWRHYCAEQLERLPDHFRERVMEILTLSSFTGEELVRRRDAFMEMWREMIPVVEGETGLTFEEMLEVV
jgi:hypothetical protein